MKVGILQLLNNLAPLNWNEHIYDRWFRKQFVSLMPQAVAVWCRQLGHRVHYATFCGQGDRRWVYEEKILRPSVMEIDLDAILHNLEAIQQWVGPSVRQFAVLKSNAYGFGVKEVGLTVEQSMAFGIAVADLSEAFLPNLFMALWNAAELPELC